jgi:hypothetical protein
MATSVNPSSGGSTALFDPTSLDNAQIDFTSGTFGTSQTNNIAGTNSNPAGGNGTTTAPSTGAALEAKMKQDVSTLVGDGKNGQYSDHSKTVAAVQAKYATLTGDAKTKFLAQAKAIGAPLGLNFGLKDASGKALNADVKLTGDAAKTQARLLKEFEIKGPVKEESDTTSQPAATTTPAVTNKATTRDTVDPSVATTRAAVIAGVDKMDTSGDGKISSDELRVFAVKNEIPLSDKAYNELLTETMKFEEVKGTNLVMPKTAVVDFLLNTDHKDTMFTNDVANAER